MKKNILAVIGAGTLIALTLFALAGFKKASVPKEENALKQEASSIVSTSQETQSKVYVAQPAKEENAQSASSAQEVVSQSTSSQLQESTYICVYHGANCEFGGQHNYCTAENHKHYEGCYNTMADENGRYCHNADANHVHNEACYSAVADANGTYCHNADANHVHNEGCYSTAADGSGTYCHNTDANHAHNDNCYSQNGNAGRGNGQNHGGRHGGNGGRGRNGGHHR